jgi:ribosomal-protein-alanine N-acetyltransferase
MLTLNFNPFPALETERLLLRQVTKKDVDEMYFLRSNAEVIKYLDREPFASRTEANEMITRINRELAKNETLFWGIESKENPGKLIGTICYWHIKPEHYRAETGYLLHPAYWRRGIMKEALAKVIDYGLNTLQLHSIEAHISPYNAASAALLVSLGFEKEAYFRENFYFREKFLDTAVYSLIRRQGQ